MNAAGLTERDHQRYEARRLAVRLQRETGIDSAGAWRVLAWLVAHKPEAAVLDRMAPSSVDHEARVAGRGLMRCSWCGDWGPSLDEMRHYHGCQFQQLKEAQA